MKRAIPMAWLLMLAACAAGDDASPAANDAAAVSTGASAEPVVQLTPAERDLLRSDALKAAIHQALATGRNQRWADGGLSGYAVPSLTAAPNGCRAVRYTVDQRPDTAYQPINACEGNR